MESEYITIREAAQITGTSYPTIQRWIYQGRLKAYKFPSGTVHIRRTDLDAAIKEFQPVGVSRE